MSEAGKLVNSEVLKIYFLDQIERLELPKRYCVVLESPKKNYVKVRKTELRVRLGRCTLGGRTLFIGAFVDQFFNHGRIGQSRDVA